MIKAHKLRSIVPREDAPVQQRTTRAHDIYRNVIDGRVVGAGVSVTCEMYGHDQEVMSLNPSWIDLGVSSTAVLSST